MCSVFQLICWNFGYLDDIVVEDGLCHFQRRKILRPPYFHTILANLAMDLSVPFFASDRLVPTS